MCLNGSDCFTKRTRGVSKLRNAESKCGIEKCGNGCGTVGKMRNAERVKNFGEGEPQMSAKQITSDYS